MIVNSKKRKRDNSQVWFDNRCKENRKLYHRARSNYRKCKVKSNLDSLRNASRQYKKSIIIAIRTYHGDFNRNYVDYAHLIQRNFGACYVQMIERIKQITLN